MARLIPDSAFSDPEMTPGERRLVRNLYQSLEDSCIVWYQPNLPSARRPDLIVYIPTIGLILYEVKDWSLENVISANADSWDVKFNGEIKSETNPFKRVRGYFYKLIDRLNREEMLISKDERHKGKIKFPIATAIAFANINKNDFLKNPVSKTIDSKYVLFKDEISEIGNSLVGKALLDKIKTQFDPWWSNEELNEQELDSLRGILYPEITSKQKEKGGRSKTIILDETQEQVAKKIGDGHRIVRGVAGSGKSLVLCAKIKMLLKEKPKWNILLTCFNISLASQLKYYLESFSEDEDPKSIEIYKKEIASRVKVVHFHGLAKEIIPRGQWPIINDSQILKTAKFANLEEYEKEAELDEMKSSLLGQKLQELAVTRPMKLFDAIIIDESQDFHPAWLKALLLMLNGETNFLLLAEDPNQKIYPRSFSYKDAGINVVGSGRIFNLPVSYRSTKEIVLTASKLVRKSDWDDFYKKYLEENGDEQKEVTTKKNGNYPEIFIKKDYSEICGFIAADIINKVKKEDYSYSDFGIIYLSKNKKLTLSENQLTIFNENDDVDYVNTLRGILASQKIPNFWLSENNDTKMSYDQFKQDVTISTVFSAKGLEFEVAYLVGVELYPWFKRNTRENASMLYVAMTRAKSELCVCSLEETKTVLNIREIIKELKVTEK
jgi:hypothetical protein